MSNKFTEIKESGLFTYGDSFFEVNLETIVFRWIVGSGDRNSQIDIEATGGKMHHGSGDYSEIYDVATLIGNTTRKLGVESGGGSADVAADSNFFGAEVDDDGSAKFVGEFIIKFFAVNTPDIVRFENFRFKHR